MGITRLLSKQKLIWCNIVLLGFLFMTSCKETTVNYDSFLEKPFAVKKEASLEINLGYTAASANWIKPSIRFEGDSLYISGVLTFKESPRSVSVRLPDAGKKYHVFWVDKNGKKAELTVRE